jgi:hypothetical protein
MRIGVTLPWLFTIALFGLGLGAWSLRQPAPGKAAQAMAAGRPAPAIGADTGVDADRPAIPAPKGAMAVRRPLQAQRMQAPTQAEIRSRMEAAIRNLDNRFVAEPLDAAWAARGERSINGFFDAAALRTQGLAMPSSASTTCHSATCRITARYDDPAAAEQTTQRLAMHLADTLPYGAVMPRQLADGSVEVDAWYSSSRITL